MAIQAKRIVVHGRVQGVGFRYFVQRSGARLGLRGNVWNRSDSAVEILAEGSEADLNAFLLEVSLGPNMARVDRVDVEDVPTGLRFTSFMIEGF
jgi:acylphosphatase